MYRCVPPNSFRGLVVRDFLWTLSSEQSLNYDQVVNKLGFEHDKQLLKCND